MNKLPNGLVLNEMARKLVRGKMSPEEHSRFETALLQQFIALEVEGNPAEIARFLKQSDDFSLLEIQATLDTMHKKIEAKLIEGLAGSLSREELAWAKQLLTIYHESVSKMVADVTKTIQKSRPIQTKEP